MKISLKIFPSVKIQLLAVDFLIKWLNFCLGFFQKVLFYKKVLNPQNILIYKVGNIGDIVCAIPSFIAIRRFYPKAKITLLTSPGIKGAFGAKELLSGVWYLDKMKIYYADDIDSLDKKKKFIKDLRGNNYDLFIQIPDDLANFRTLLRNMIFAKFIGAKSAFGFKIRTIQLFKKTQVDYLFKKTEVENLIEILTTNGIYCEKSEFDFNILEKSVEKINKLLNDFKFNKNDLLIALNTAAKREANKWPTEKFLKIALFLKKRYNAKIIIIGGLSEAAEAVAIAKNIGELALPLAGQLTLSETIELLKRCSFLVSNDTGAVHMAAAVGSQVVGIYSVRNVLGSWFPYGQGHKILYRKFLDCDYKKEECIKKSIGMITFDEVARACDCIIKELNKN